MKHYTVVGSVSAALSVILGAFAAHGLKHYLDVYALGVFKTAVEYQFNHSVGLILVTVLALHRTESKPLLWAARLFCLGIILFSGSLYGVSLLGVKWLGAITPIGGLSFIAAWLLMALAIFRYQGAQGENNLKR